MFVCVLVTTVSPAKITAPMEVFIRCGIVWAQQTNETMVPVLALDGRAHMGTTW